MAGAPPKPAAEETQDQEKSAVSDATNTENTGEVKENAAPVRGKRMVLFMILGVVILSVAGGGGFITYKKFGKKVSEEMNAASSAQATTPLATSHYYELDGFIVNLSSNLSQSNFLKLTVTLELPSEAGIDAVTQNMPLIRDTFQTYLRELRPDDLRGSAGLYRLREELLLRVNTLLYPAKANNVLFKEILVQ